MPKWARTMRAGASRATLGEASGKEGTRPPVKFTALNIGKATVQFWGIIKPWYGHMCAGQICICNVKYAL